tara:strand:- start:21465 stop:21656 length:192 start_codon:yes stop_codon:yes gene_type:complete
LFNILNTKPYGEIIIKNNKERIIGENILDKNNPNLYHSQFNGNSRFELSNPKIKKNIEITING